MNFQIKQIFTLLFTVSLVACAPKLLHKTIYVDRLPQHSNMPADESLLTKEAQNGKWAPLNANIEGFTYEDGFEYKLEVTQKAEGKEPDLTLVKILDKKQKEIAVVPEISKTLSKKTWKLKELYQAGFAVAIEAEKITLEFDLENRRFSGQAPCNRYFGSINLLTKTGLLPGPVASTRRACGRTEDNVLETQYFEAFGLINQYQMDDKQLKLFKESQLVLVFE